MHLDKSILIEYCDMMAEIKDLRRRIIQDKKDIKRIESEGMAADTVKGGSGGRQHFTVEGFPHPKYERKKRLLRQRMARLERCEAELLDLTNQAEEYIESIEKSELRTMFRLYFIDGLTYSGVAMHMNSLYPKRRVKYTDENIKKRIQRFFEKN